MRPVFCIFGPLVLGNTSHISSSTHAAVPVASSPAGRLGDQDSTRIFQAFCGSTCGPRSQMRYCCFSLSPTLCSLPFTGSFAFPFPFIPDIHSAQMLSPQQKSYPASEVQYVFKLLHAVSSFLPSFLPFFLAAAWHVEVPGPGIKPVPQLQQRQILNPLHHPGTSSFPSQKLSPTSVFPGHLFLMLM